MARFALALVLMSALVIGAAACTGPASGAGGGAARGGTSGRAAADVTVIGRDMAFTPTTLTVRAGVPFTLHLVNEDAAPHNVAIYVDSSAGEEVFLGDVIGEGEITYAVPALAAGTYFFRCDVHPAMTGTLVVES